MKLGYRILTCFCFLSSLSLLAQEGRYLNEVFTDVEVTSNVPYGANFSVLAVPVIGTTFKQQLVMDVYQPMGDTATGRPLVIVLHTGNFLPIQTNGGVTGEKTDSAVVEVCKRLARMGYVAASADYRLGWNPLAQTQPERALGLINAAYRGVQDARTCVRFFKRDFVEFGDNYRIDTGKIVMWGQGTGGYISLAAATLDSYNKIPITTMPPGKFLTDLNGDNVPDPMVIEPFNGDIYGASIVGLSPGGAVPAGDTLALPNHPGYSSDFKLTVNMGGALADISWLDENSPAVISYQVVNDQFAPYESAILIVPTTNDPIVEVQGSLPTVTKANELGLNEAFKDVDGDIFTEAAKSASATAGHDYQNGLYPFNIPLNILGRADGSPWNWWSPEKWDTIPFPGAVALGLPEGTTYHFVALLSDMNMSPEKGRTYIDTIMGYFAPRAYQELNLAPDSTLAVTLLDKSAVSLTVSPNPSYGLLTLQSHPDYEMKSMRILDVTGKTVFVQPRVNASQLQIEHNHLTAGTYLVEIRFEKGIVTEKVLLH
jgi:acetyl esterase/lipase